MEVEAALTLLFGLLDRAAAWGAEINAARNEGRKVNVDLFVAQDDAARTALEEAIRQR